jgi:WD40 repeat protein
MNLPAMAEAVAFSPDGTWLGCGAWDGARLWKITGSELRAELPEPMMLEKNHVEGIAFSPDGRWLATCGQEKTVRLWDLSSPDSIPPARHLHGHNGNVKDVAFSKKGNWFASGGYDNVALLWDSKNLGEDPVRMTGHTSNIYSLAFTADERFLITGSQDRTARVWELQVDILLDLAKQRAGRQLTPTERQQYQVQDD